MSVSELERPAVKRSARELKDERTMLLFEQLAQASEEDDRRRLRDEIIELNIEIARSIASRYRDRGEPLEDLEQVACLGLIQAVSRYDLSHGRHFMAFAVPTISGEIKKHFRDRAWTVLPPRRIQDLQGRIAARLPELYQELRRSPTTSELAAALEEPEDAVSEALAADGCFQPTSLELPISQGDDPVELADVLGAADDQMQQLELQLSLSQACEALSDADRQLLSLRFVHELTQARIAERLGTNQMAVSRSLARVLTSMHANI